MKRTLLALPALLLGLTAPALAQRDLSNVEIKTIPVAGKVYMLEGAGGNIGVSVGDDGILIIDDQFAPLADKIKAALGKLGNGKLRFVLNTHFHGDHTGGNPIFGKEAPIIAHKNVRKRLANPANPPAMSKEGLPVITFDDTLSVHFNGEEIRAVHAPFSHTDGDIVLFFIDSNVVHTGDIFFANRFPFIDMNSGGSVPGLIRSIETLARILPENVKIIPGHGAVSSLSDLKAYHQMLLETSRLVREKVEAGKTLEQVKSEGFPAKYKEWGSGFITADRWAETLYNTYAKKDDKAAKNASTKTVSNEKHTHADGTHH